MASPLDLSIPHHSFHSTSHYLSLPLTYHATSMKIAALTTLVPILVPTLVHITILVTSIILGIHGVPAGGLRPLAVSRWRDPQPRSPAVGLSLAGSVNP